ncbi:MAG: hypothetical protein A4E43_01381 [Methanosaeta sp. PtaB.Bin005]|nr:MAG: hypothetical protein A4E43_01381 [Methanosaeta sp. PtaB.Bin005]
MSEVREVAVTSTMALMVDMAADMAASRMIPSKPLGRISVATNGTRPSGFLRNGAICSALNAP